jgi:hypothetical protein
MDGKRGRKPRRKTPTKRVREHPELNPENPVDNTFELVSDLSWYFFDARHCILSRGAVVTISFTSTRSLPPIATQVIRERRRPGTTTASKNNGRIDEAGNDYPGKPDVHRERTTRDRLWQAFPRWGRTKRRDGGRSRRRTHEAEDDDGRGRRPPPRQGRSGIDCQLQLPRQPSCMTKQEAGQGTWHAVIRSVVAIAIAMQS